MSLSSGSRLGPYEIVAPIGAGGMGEVYRARDTRLDRTVAIKVLPAHVANHPEARQRFEREARAVSSLNHPHICVLHDIGREGEVDFMVMEYLEGETLGTRLGRGPLGPDQVARFATQIADALGQAHKQGVFHRDLKPGNIMLTRTGAKLLDFGLAKFQSPASPGDATLSLALTQKGTILGTFQYMAPEQIEGREIDGRTDIFSFGAVLYEMVTGQKAFSGATHTSLVASILAAAPPPLENPSLDRVVRRCLAKDPDQRWQSAMDLGAELQWAAAPFPSSPHPLLPSSRLPWLAAGVLLLAALPFVVAYFRRPAAEEAAPVRFSILPPEKSTFVATHSISPDGRLLAFRASAHDGQIRIHVRPLDSFAARPLSGTEGATFTFWSADSRFIGFGAQGKLKKSDVTGGPPQTIADGFGAGGSAWNRDGVIVTSRSLGDVLYRVPAAGGTPTALTELDRARGETGHMHPHFLPDGRHFLYLASSSQPENTSIYAASLDTPKAPKRILNVVSQAMYSSPGYLLFVREATLLAQRFDADRLQTSGEVVALAEQIRTSNPTSLKLFSVSANGVLAYRTGGAPMTQLAWFDRAGKALGPVGSPASYSTPKLSPDQKRLVVERADPQTGSTDLWLFDFLRGATTRFTFDPANDAFPAWSPDGTRIAFGSGRDGLMNVYQKLSSGAGDEELLLKSGEGKYPTDWSPDGRFLLYTTQGGDVWLLPLSGDRKPVPFLQTPFFENWARFSPDGRWIAYQSNASGRQEVYVQPFREGSGAGSAGMYQVSTDGGTDAQWRRDGKELFYLAPDRTLMAVDVKAGGAPSGPFEAGSPRPLFATRALAVSFVFTVSGPSSYVVSADGQRFLVTTPVEEAAPTPIHVVLNWAAGLKK